MKEMPQPGEEEQGELPENNEGAGKMQREALCRVQGSKACAQNLGSAPVTAWTVRWAAEESVGKASVSSEPRPQNQKTKQQDKTERGWTQSKLFLDHKEKGKLVKGMILKMRNNNSLIWFLFSLEENALWTGKNKLYTRTSQQKARERKGETRTSSNGCDTLKTNPQ